jgi:hypothetical protein
MPKPPRTYRRLTRPASSLGSYRSLWLAADHLLIVTSTGFSEEYQRLELRNIRGFFVVDSERRILWCLPWAIIALISSVALLNTLYGHKQPYVSGTFLALSVVLLIWNYLLGPGCTAHVVTGVQTAVLPSVVRKRKARRFLAIVEPAISEIQAGMAAAPPAVPPAGEPPGLPPGAVPDAAPPA